MTMQINIQINADADGGFTASEQSILSALSGNAPAAAAEVQAPAPAPVKAEPKRRAPAAKKPVQEDPEPEVEEDAPETADEDQEDEPEEEAPKPAKRAPVKKPAAEEVQYVVRDAINAATPLISEGAAGRAKVKAALGAVPGASKVSDLKKHEDIAAFLEALEA